MFLPILLNVGSLHALMFCLVFFAPRITHSFLQALTFAAASRKPPFLAEFLEFIEPPLPEAHVAEAMKPLVDVLSKSRDSVGASGLTSLKQHLSVVLLSSSDVYIRQVIEYPTNYSPSQSHVSQSLVPERFPSPS